MECPPQPPACTEAWSSVGIEMVVNGIWPQWQFAMTCTTGYSLPEVACDVEHGSLWAIVTAEDPGDYLSWPWIPLATDLYVPADGSGFVAEIINIRVHLRDWFLVGDHMATVAAAGVNVDGEATALTCPAQPAPQLGVGDQINGPDYGWPPDLDGNGIIGLGDLMLLLEQWGAPWDVQDFLDILLLWGSGSPWT